MNLGIGQIYIDKYPPAAAIWCNSNNAYIEEIERENGKRRFQIVAIPAPTLEEARAAKLTEINSACDAILNAAVLTYPETEVLTFDQQTSEAKAYQASGNASDAPLLSALAAGRGIRLDDLVQRVMAKHTAFSALSGYVIGQRQALEDRLDASTTVEEIEAITVDIAVPDITGGDTETDEGETSTESVGFAETQKGSIYENSTETD